MQPKPMTKDEIQSVLKLAVDGAIDYIDGDLSSERQKAMRYFEGQVDLSYEEGRSKVVATKCRDIVRAIKPSIMRVFFQDRPVEFQPRTAQDVLGAEQATEYARFKLSESNGFRLISNAFHDALIQKTGVLKVYYDETEDSEIDEYTGLTDEQMVFIAGDDEVEVLEHSEREEIIDGGMQIVVHDLKVSRTKTSGSIKIKSVPPEDFFVDQNATSLEDFYVCGHRCEMRVGDLVAMGFDFNEVSALDGMEDDSEEDDIRDGESGYENDENASDPSMKKVQVTEAYMRMDIEGTGVPRLYSFICGGTKHKILDHDVCDDLPFAVFEVDPEPHTFFGRSLVDLIINDQDAATSMLRGLLDNVNMVNTPRLAAVEDQVNIDDLLNNEIGGIVRVRSLDAVRDLQVAPIGMSVLPAIQYYDEAIEGKTGVTRASMGLNADALQSATKTAVDATVTGAMGQAEVIVRHLAEGGMKQVFKLIHRLARKHVEAEEMIRVNGQFVAVDPRSWTADMDVICNVGLGTGQKEEKAMALAATLQTQMTIWSTYGPTNGLVTMSQIRNTLADQLALQGIHNADRYYNQMSPEQEQILLAQAAQAQQPQQDPNASLAQAEVMKAQISAQSKQQSDMARLQLDQAKAAEEAQRKRTELAARDDLERDRMAQELAVKGADLLGKYGVQLDRNRIQAEQNKPRRFGEQ